MAAAGTKTRTRRDPRGLSPARSRRIEAPAIQPESAPITEIMHNPAQIPIRLAAEPGRNALCPCGSGVKFKPCCANPIPLTVPAAA